MNAVLKFLGFQVAPAWGEERAPEHEETVRTANGFASERQERIANFVFEKYDKAFRNLAK